MSQSQTNYSLASFPMNTQNSQVTKSQLMDIRELKFNADVVKYIRHFKCLYDFEYVGDDNYKCGKEPNFDLKEHTLNLLLNYTKNICDDNCDHMKQFIYQVVESEVYELFYTDLDSCSDLITETRTLTETQYVFRILWLFTNVYAYEFEVILIF